MTDTSLPQPIGARVLELLTRAVLAPIRAFRLPYLPLLMVYFAYGALGIIAVADSFWVKKELTLSPAALAHLGVWLTLPWACRCRPRRIRPRSRRSSPPD